MKCKVRLTRTVELIVEGKSEEQIQNWLNETTPEDVYLATDGDVDDSYDEDILYVVADDSKANYVIE